MTSIYDNNTKKVIIKSRLFSTLTMEKGVFFSLATYKNDLFMNKDPKKVLEFYESINNVQEMITWLEERPKGRAEIFEVDGDSEIVVVIPTADHNNTHAKRCSEEIFHGFRIIFVESGNFSDPFFSFSHNCNIGIKKALEYNPKYIIWTNDDMIKIDEPEKLKSELIKVRNQKPKVIFANSNYQVSTPVKIVKFNILGSLILKLISELKINIWTWVNKSKNNIFLNTVPFKMLLERYIKLFFYNKFQTEFFLANIRLAPTSFLFTNRIIYHNFDAFGILDCNFVKSLEEVFDEHLIVQHADQDLSLRFGIDPKEVAWIDYSIKGVGRATIKDNFSERLRNLIADVYIDYKISKVEYGYILTSNS